MVLKARTKVIQSPNSRTQYITIPAVMVSDSQYPLKPNQEVEIVVHADEQKIEILITKHKGENKMREAAAR